MSVAIEKLWFCERLAVIGISVTLRSAQHGFERPGQNGQIVREGQGPVISGIADCTLRKGQIRLIRNLAKTSDARLQIVVISAGIKRRRRGHHRSWAYKAHITGQHVEELWQFVKRGFAQELSETGKAGSIERIWPIPALMMPVVLQPNISIFHHKTQLPHPIDVPVLANLILPVEWLATVKCNQKG